MDDSALVDLDLRLMRYFTVVAEHQHLDWRDGRDALLDHRVDALVTRLPFPTDQLDVTVLYDEPRVLVVPLDHRLAGKESVTIDDIADEPLPMLQGDSAWNAFWCLDPRPDGSRGARRPGGARD